MSIDYTRSDDSSGINMRINALTSSANAALFLVAWTSGSQAAMMQLRAPSTCESNEACVAKYVSVHAGRLTGGIADRAGHAEQAPSNIDSGVATAVCNAGQCKLTCKGGWYLSYIGHCVDQKYGMANRCQGQGFYKGSEGCICGGAWSPEEQICTCPDGQSFQQNGNGGYLCR